MSRWYADNSLSIGRTPLIKLNRIAEGAPASLFAKIEGRNPAYSVKCRIGAAMIWDAEQRGLLGPVYSTWPRRSWSTRSCAGRRSRGRTSASTRR